MWTGTFQLQFINCLKHQQYCLSLCRLISCSIILYQITTLFSYVGIPVLIIVFPLFLVEIATMYINVMNLCKYFKKTCTVPQTPIFNIGRACLTIVNILADFNLLALMVIKKSCTYSKVYLKYTLLSFIQIIEASLVVNIMYTFYQVPVLFSFVFI